MFNFNYIYTHEQNVSKHVFWQHLIQSLSAFSHTSVLYWDYLQSQKGHLETAKIRHTSKRRRIFRTKEFIKQLKTEKHWNWLSRSFKNINQVVYSIKILKQQKKYLKFKVLSKQRETFKADMKLKFLYFLKYLPFAGLKSLNTLLIMKLCKCKLCAKSAVNFTHGGLLSLTSII